MTDERIDLNQADQESLASLPGIGIELAARIVHQREEVGLFERMDDLLVVPGISYEMVRAISGLVYLGTSEEATASTAGNAVVDRDDEDSSLSGFRIERQISSSQHSDAFVGYAKNGDGPYQVEIVHGDLDNEGDLVQDFLRAMDAVQSIDHPGIVKIEKLDITEGKELCLIWPHTKGMPLPGYVALMDRESEKTSAVQALLIAQKTAETLNQAHQSGVVHKHLTSESVYLTADLDPFLLGLDRPASEYSHLRPHSSGALDNQYLSPEQREGKALDGRSNVYSLGVILYEVLASMPIGTINQGSSDLVLLEDIRPDLTDRTYALIDTSIQPNAWDRYQSMREMIDGIESAIWAEKATEAGLIVAPLSGADVVESVVGTELSQTAANGIDGIESAIWAEKATEAGLIVAPLSGTDVVESVVGTELSQTAANGIDGIESAIWAEKATEAGLIVAPLSGTDVVESVVGTELSQTAANGQVSDLSRRRRRSYVIGIAALVIFLAFIALRMNSQLDAEGNRASMEDGNGYLQAVRTVTAAPIVGDAAPTLDIIAGTLTARARLAPNTLIMGATPTFIPTPTDTPTPKPTHTPTSTPTVTPTATPTDTPTTTPTDTPTPTRRPPRPTSTPVPTSPPPTSPPGPTSSPPPPPTSPPPTPTPPRPG